MTDTIDATPTETPIEAEGSRRSLLRKAAVGGAGAAAAVLAFDRTASAADGSNVVLGDETLTAETPTVIDVTPGAAPTGTGPSALSVGGYAPPAASPFAAAIGGYGDTTILHGIHGSTTAPSGLGVVAANLAPALPAASTDAAPAALAVAAIGGPQIKFVPLPGAVAGPTTGTHSPGELYVDADGTLWFTVPVAPVPPATVGGVRFVKLAGTPTAGQFHVLPVAQRIFDSRKRVPATKLASGATVALDLTKAEDKKDSGMPAGATAAVVNITLDQTERAGFARIVATGTDLKVVTTSNINWYENNQIGANQATVALSAAGGATLEIGGTTGGTTHILVDLQGYYL